MFKSESETRGRTAIAYFVNGTRQRIYVTSFRVLGNTTSGIHDFGRSPTYRALKRGGTFSQAMGFYDGGKAKVRQAAHEVVSNENIGLDIMINARNSFT